MARRAGRHRAKARQVAVRFEPEAAAEATEAASWYESRSAGLGLAFLDDLDRALSAIATRPGAFPLLSATAPVLGLRRAILRRFPFGVVFRTAAEDVRVIAVAHVKREPAYWLHRVIDP